MKIDVLSQLILKHIKMHSARLSFFAQMIMSAIKTGKVSLKRLVEEIGGEATLESKIRRCQKFFQEQELDMISGGKLIVAILGIIGKVKIVIDRTNWDYGKTTINYFVASVILGNMAIPIYWMPLDKKGNSSTKERILLSEMLFQIIPKEQIECILGDREFIGQAWFQWLIDQKIKFIIRLKENFVIEVGGKETWPVVLFSELKEGQELYKQVLLWGIPLTIVAKRLADNSLLILASNYVHHTQLCEVYKKRWAIEICFKNLKSNGFDLESTHMTEPEKLSKLMLILAIALAITVKTGLLRASEKPIKILKNGRATFSLFTYGIDYLRSYIFRISKLLNQHMTQIMNFAIYYH
jgi:hypothetical protein